MKEGAIFMPEEIEKENYIIVEIEVSCSQRGSKRAVQWKLEAEFASLSDFAFYPYPSTV